MSDHQRRLMNLFDEVSSLPVAERAARLDALRSGDAALAAELQALLDAGSEHTAYAQAGVTAAVAVQRGRAGGPEVLGGYRILRVLGQGGMGIVYEAQQELPQRKVALKVIRKELGGPSLRRRFELESNILGRLAHPGISRIYEAAVEDETCFFAMELVDGKPLVEHADARKLDVAARLELFARVCDAVHHAHLRGVIHLDLKPANILVGADGQPKVLDFGIARLVDPDTALTNATLEGHILGTPSYMSPEQTECVPSLLDARSDVYTLGAIGYELLSGKLPHDSRGLPIPEVIMRIRARDAPPLSTRRPELRGDVEIIFGKALAREPEARYQSAGALAADVRRHLTNQPIEARAPTAGYQLRLFARRNRGLAAALAGLAAALVAGALVAVLFAAHALRASAELAARNDALAVLEARASLREDPTRAVARLKTLSDGAVWDDARAVALEADEAGVARAVLLGHTGEVHAVDVDAAGRTVASVSYDGTVRLWDLQAHTVRVVPTGAELHEVSFQPGGPLLAVAGNGALRLIAPDGSSRALAGHEGWVTSIAWSPRGPRLASAGEDGTVRVWLGTDQVVMQGGHEGGATRVAWSRDGVLVASGDFSGKLHVFPAEGGEASVLAAHDGELVDLVFAGDDLYTCGRDGRVLRWTSIGAPPSTIDRLPDELKRLAASRDGRWVAWADRRGEVTLYEPASGARQALGSVRGAARTLAFSPDGQVLAAAGDGRVVALWSVAGGDRLDLLGHSARVRSLAFSGDGRTLASAGDDGSARVWPARVPFGAGARVVAADGARRFVAVAGGADATIRVRRLPEGPVRRLAGHSDEIYDLAFSPDGRRLASASRDHTVRVWDVDGDAAAAPRTLALGERAVRVAFGPGKLAAGGAAGALKLWDPEGGAITDLVGHADRVNDLRFSPDGRTLASAADDRSVRVWDVASGEGRVLGELPERAHVVAFSPDGLRLAAAGDDGAVRVWPLAGDLGAAKVYPLHQGLVTALAFSADGARLASGGVDRGVQVIDLASGTTRLVGRHAGAVVRVLYAGDELLTAAADGSARAWSEAGGRLLALGHGPALAAELTADDRLALVTGEDGLRLVPLQGGRDAAAVRARLAELTEASLAGDVLAEVWSEATPAAR